MAIYKDVESLEVIAYQGENEDFDRGVAFILEKLDKLPTADATEVKHGRWIEETEYYDDDYSECNVRKIFVCSLCGRTEKQKEPYCNCGAKMDEGDE